MATVYKTLSELIKRSTKYDLSKITYYTKTSDGDIILADTNLFQIYMRYIRSYVVTYAVTEEKRTLYRHKPGLLSTEIYGVPDLAWMILKLNDQECPSKFRMKSTIKLIPVDSLNTIYDTIVTKSTEKLTANWNQFLSDME